MGSLLTRHPHIHALFSCGLFLPGGDFRPASAIPPWVIEKLFQKLLLDRLVSLEAIPLEVAEGMKSWEHSGFHAYLSRPVDPADKDHLENVAGYLVKGLISLKRLFYCAEKDRVTIEAEKPHPKYGWNRRFTGQDFLLELLPHLAHRPWERSVLYYGWYSHRTRGKRRKEAEMEGGITAETVVLPAGSGKKERSWARLLKKVFDIDLVCPRGSERKTVIAWIQDKGVIYRILKHLKLLPPDPRSGSLPSRERSPPTGALPSPQLPPL